MGFWGFNQFVVSSPSFLLVVPDPLHLQKWIRYRLLSGEFRVAPTGSTHIFSITKIHTVAQLHPVVFDNSRITKLHEPLPLNLLSCDMVLSVFTTQ
jgi:hypothetical protein